MSSRAVQSLGSVDEVRVVTCSGEGRECREYLEECSVETEEADSEDTDDVVGLSSTPTHVG